MKALKMDWNFPVCFFLITVSQSVVAFNIDPKPWKELTDPDQGTAFGYKVIQTTTTNVIVSDPLIQTRDKRGKLYNCGIRQETCSPITINVPSEAINMSLGLSMNQDPKSSNLVVCGPTIPKNCTHFTAYNGMCFTLDSSFKLSEPIPNRLRECPPPSQTDIAFLLDGSGSVTANDFSIMKNFVIDMVNGLRDRDFQFAVAQYSSYCELHIKFNTFSSTDQIRQITQFRHATYTATAIKKVVNELFTREAGARDNVNRVLLVITDGESHDADQLENAARQAQQKNITRYAIGVGSAFVKPNAEKELKTIASDPDENYVFKVNDFSVLKEIRDKLEQDIIAIEGTQSSGKSTTMQFAQDGFSADFLSNETIIMGAVGAYQWKGGYQMYNKGGATVDSFQQGNSNDSYLGYSMTVAKPSSNLEYIIQGAPRANHRGNVIIQGKNFLQTLDSPEPQIGAYFGAELCAVDLNSDKITDLLLVSAPLHNDGDQEGKVFIYTFKNNRFQLSQIEYIRAVKGISGQRGRFGMTLASSADLDGDRRADVVIGAPLEENGQGSIYIFNGRNGDIFPTFSQRITGSSVRSRLQFFGLSLSKSAPDHSGDQLPDLAVGSKGAVLLLRSRPIVFLSPTITYKPSKIPTKEASCVSPLRHTLTLCFTMSERNGFKDLAANINYTLTLDATRKSYRAFFSEKQRVKSGSISVLLGQKCTDHNFLIEPCPNDVVNPITTEIVYSFEGLPSKQLSNLSPVLHPNVKNSSTSTLDFEIDCGEDKICIDNLKVDFNFSGNSVIQVGIMQEMNVTVFIANREENSYNARVNLKYPFGLSFRKFTTRQGRLECQSVDSDEKAALGETTCFISKPIFKSNGVAVFDVTYSINKDSDFDRKVTFIASATSDNDRHSNDTELLKTRTIDVKYAIYIAMIRHENSTIHINFTARDNTIQKPVRQIFKVENELRDLSFNVFIRVPIKIGTKDIWTDKNLQIQGCNFDEDKQPTIKDFAAALKNKPEVNCSVAVCRVFKCAANLIKKQTVFYNVSGNVSSGWIEQTGLRSVVFELVSTATLDYNKTTYIYSSDTLNSEPIAKIITQIEVYEEKFPLKETVGGVVAGLVLLALVAVALYKAGFFKSNYKTMLEEAETGAGETGEGDQ